MSMTLLHGTTVEIDGLGIFITGPSGSGKSDLAIRLMDRGAKLVADDYTEILVVNNGLSARPPQNIKGKIEARGIGIIKVENINQTDISIVVQLQEADEIERMPETQNVTIEGVELPVVFLCAKHASSVAKLFLYLKSLE